MRSSLGMAIKGLLAGSVAVAIATSTHAVSQGALGFTSTGSVDISLNVADEVQTNNLEDIDLGDFSGADLTGSTPACIFRNGGNTGFELTASGSGTAGAYVLTDTSNTVAYSVSISTGGADTDLDTNTPATFTSAVNTPDCAGIANNATISVTVDAADAATLPASAYTGTLTLVVSPN